MRTFLILCLSVLLISCGFHAQGEKHLAQPLQNLYLQTPDPYGQLARSLKQYLKLSGVRLAATPAEAATILAITQDEPSQELLSVSGTQQTRQYTLRITVTFNITTTKGMTLLGPQTLSESRTITIQSNQILGSSNEANLFYQQMRRNLAYSILNRIASREVTRILNETQLHTAGNTSQ